MTKKHRLLGLVLALTLVLGCTKAARQGENGKPEDDSPEEPEVIIPIQADYPMRGDISAHFETTTRVVAENRVEVIPEGMGECVAVNVEEGDTVEKGQVLAELDKDEALAALRQLEIQVAQQRTAYQIAERSFAEGLGAEVERDNARFAYDQARANLEAQQLKVDNLTIRAPIGGLVTRKSIQKGQIVSTGTPAFSLVDPFSYMLEIHPPEKELSRLKLGQVARVSVDALDGKEFAATVRRINPAVDPVTGTLKVVLDFGEETRKELREAAFARVRLVMETHENAVLLPKDALVDESGRKYVFVVVEAPDEEEQEEQEEGEKAPEGDEACPDDTKEASEQPAVSQAQDDAAVSETEDTEEQEGDADKSDEEDEDTGPRLVANRVEVQTGLEDSNYIEILAGIDADSLVVTLGQHTLKPGSRVRVTNAEAELDAKADMSVEEALEAAKAERAKTKAEKAKKDKGTKK